MADDFEAAPVVPVGTSTTADRMNDRGGRRRSSSGRQEGPRFVVDVASFLGLPVGAIPPAVQESIAALVDEVERLRAEVERLRHHEAFLAEEADHHPVIGVLNRRGFLRLLARLLDTCEREALPGSVICLHVGGVERVRVVHGLAAGDAALRHVAEALRSDVRQSDLVGYLDGGHFAVALALADSDNAEEKARQIAERLADQPFDWQGLRFLFTVGMGVAHFQPYASAEQMLSAADAARRGADAARSA